MLALVNVPFMPRDSDLLVTFQQRYLGWTEDLNGVRVWLPVPVELHEPTLPSGSLTA